MLQLILHLVGDYLLQSDWMAENKTKNWFPCFIHSILYTLPFFIICSIEACMVICITHYLIDRFRLVKYILRIKEIRWVHIFKYTEPGRTKGFLRNYWENLKIFWRLPHREFGYNSNTKPIWMWAWLLTIADNTLHLALNYLSIKYL